MPAVLGKRTVVVVGGGISGLVAADELADTHHVILVESTARLGGKIRTSEVGGLLVDEGAESFLARRPEATRLVESLGLEMIHPATMSAAVLIDGRLCALPKGTVFGIPGDLAELRASGILTSAELDRVAEEPEMEIEPLVDDISVGELVEARMGRAVVEKLVDPLLGGVYAGRAAGISLEAAAPALANQLRHGGSLTAAARAVSYGASDGGPVFGTVRDGLYGLVEALCARLMRRGVELRLGTPATSLHPRGEAWSVQVGVEQIAADAVILACPAAPAAKLLAELAPSSARLLGDVEYSSVAIATLVYDRSRFTRQGSSGYLVPAAEGRATKAVTFMSAKWDRHAAEGSSFVLRASVGRFGDTDWLQLDDEALLAKVQTELVGDLGAPPPQASRLTRWGGALPQYAPGHMDRVTPIRAGLPASIEICGAALDGVGIPACIASARRAADAMASTLLRQSTHD